MSDEINWIPVGIWSAGVIVQINSAIRSWRMNRGIREEERRLVESDWCKMQRGEMKRGFRMWLERQCCPKKSILEERCHHLFETPLPNDYDWSEWSERELTSVFMAIYHPMPNSGQRVLNLRRYSFFDATVYTDIAQVIYPTRGGWFPLFNIQLDNRTVASAYYNFRSHQICAILIDIKHRSYRLLKIPSIIPSLGGFFKIMYMRRGVGVRSNRLRIVGDYSWTEFHEIISIDYEIRPSKKSSSRLFAVEIGRQSIFIPGSRWRSQLHIPGAYKLQAAEQNQSSFAITIDQRGDFQLHHYGQWKTAMMATGLELRSRKAIDDFDALLPEQLRTERSCAQYYKHMLGNVGDSFAKRHLNPPSMMHLAAEASCRAKPPNADLSMIKSETGIDIFDGIIEDREKPVPTIYFPSEDEWNQDE